MIIIPIFSHSLSTHWALTYLKHAGLLVGTKSGFFKITERGKQIVNQNLEKIDHKFLKQFSEFKEFTRDEKKCKAVGRSKRK